MVREIERAKRSVRERPTRTSKRKRLLQLVIVGIIAVINVVFIVISVKRQPRKTVVVSSTFVCDSAGDKDCLAKQWVRKNSFKNWGESCSDILILEDHIHDCEKIPRGIHCQEHQCLHPSLGLPYVKCLIQSGMEQYPKSTIVFTNDDILFRGLNETLDFLTDNLRQFVAVGRRTNVPLVDLIDLDDKATIEEMEKQESTEPAVDLDELISRNLPESYPFELDYFIFRIDRSVLDGYPEFVLGNWRWDNVMVDYLLLHNITVVDASRSITAFHLGKTATKQDFRKGATYNDDLMWRYFKNTASQISYKGETDPILRFGSMSFAQYKTERDQSTGLIKLAENKESIFI